MNRLIGTVVRSFRAPIIKESDDVSKIAVDTLLNASKEGNFEINNGDVLAITESVVARAQGNYAHVNDIASDVKNKFENGKVGVIFPILSRNRFAICLKGIAMGAKEIVLQLSYPSDEVGNALISEEILQQTNLNPFQDLLSEEDFRSHFGETKHTFTGVDYISYYRSIIEAAGAKCTIIFSNNPTHILKYTNNVLNCDIHSRFRTKKALKNLNATVYSLDDILNTPNDNHGFNPEYGLLGSNKSTEDTVKLFPRNCKELAYKIQEEIKKLTQKTVEVMVYGDGAFKDPVGKIWELADPVVSPGFTAGLVGTPNEIKLKYLADNNFAELKGEELKSAILNKIKEKDGSLVGQMEAQGTTPRHLTDLIGSLCDLTSGSGDKGTPIVYIQGYFDNYAS
jgi:F420-0:gamma-glutamyl ligase